MSWSFQVCVLAKTSHVEFKIDFAHILIYLHVHFDGRSLRSRAYFTQVIAFIGKLNSEDLFVRYLQQRTYIRNFVKYVCVFPVFPILPHLMHYYSGIFKSISNRD